MKKIVITGAKGGTGVSITKLFREGGYRAYGVDLKPCGFCESDYCQLDLENGAGVHDVLAGAAAVVHFGSFPTDGWTSWEAAYRNLALGGFNVLQAAANLGISRVVLAGSPEVYGSYDQQPYLRVDEDSPQAPPSIYGAVKQNLESLACNYARWHRMAIALLRPQRIVYEGSFEWRLRKFTVDDAAAAPDLWSYVDARDVAAACLAWVQSDLQGFEAFNVAADDVCVATPTRQLLQRFYPRITDLRGVRADRSGLISCDKLKHMLNWQPHHNWQAMSAESESHGFPKQPPPR